MTELIKEVIPLSSNDDTKSKLMQNTPPLSKYQTLSLLAGISCKLYDDIQDNPNLLSLNNPYINEMLKAVHYILVSIVSIYYPWFYVLLSSLHISQYGEAFYNIINNNKWKSSSYENPYEFIGLLTYIVVFGIILFPQYTKNINYKSDYIILAITLIVSFAESMSSNEKTNEYSYKKLFIRIALCIFIIYLLTVIEKSPDTTMFGLYILGYIILSVFVQAYSLYQNRHTIPPNVLPENNAPLSKSKPSHSAEKTEQ